MFFAELLFALLVALLLSMLFLPITRSRDHGDGTSVTAKVVFLFLIIFFATWAGGLWLTPVGPPLWNAYWLPFVLIGLFVALLLAVAGGADRRPYPRRRSLAAAGETETETAATALFGLLFWVLLVGLIGAIITSYLVN